MKRILISLLSFLLIGSASMLRAESIVERHGWLRVEGARLVDAHGAPVQLQGASFGWHNYWHRFFNRSSVSVLANDWQAEIVRCSIGLDLDSLCYDRRPDLAYACVDSVVRGAVEQGIYVLVDFHSHDNNLKLAKEFFSTVTKKYGKLPNVLYEIWNEPKEVPWSETKAYAEELIPLIRKNAPRSLIVVPTPRWDQEVDKAADDPITQYGNLVYALHFYAATHKDYLREKARYAISKGLPLFISECAAMEHTGDGVIDMPQWDEWMKLADENGITWIAWSVSDKVETCSMLTPGSPSRGADWKEENLKPWGLIVRKYLREAR